MTMADGYSMRGAMVYQLAIPVRADLYEESVKSFGGGSMSTSDGQRLQTRPLPEPFTPTDARSAQPVQSLPASPAQPLATHHGGAAGLSDSGRDGFLGGLRPPGRAHGSAGMIF